MNFRTGLKFISASISAMAIAFLAQGGDFFLDISSIANMGFKDEVAGDGIGGWSDQGPENDFSTFDFSQKKFGNAPFKVIDPKRNDGRAVMTFKSDHISDRVYLEEAFIGTEGVKANYLYILHTCCWAGAEGEPVGSVVAKLKGEGERTFQIAIKKDVGDWWAPSSFPNGAVVHTKPNGNGTVGVYLSKFKISDEPKEIESVCFKTAGKSIWILVGATLSTESYELPKESHFIAKESKEWKPVAMEKLVVKPGSALDLGSLFPSAPVGTYGRVTLDKDGDFVFEGKPDEKLVFLSCSFGDVELSRFTSKEDMKAFAEAIRRQGYNMVRLHFLDHYLMGGSKADFDFNEERLDLVDYFVSCLKERGIYIYFDAVTSWNGYKKGSSWGLTGVNLKKDIMALPEVREHWRTGVTKLLTHMNPYTKTKLVDDPAIAVMLFYNELEFYSFRNGGLHPAMVGEWRSWLKKRYDNDPAALAKAWNDPGRFKAGMKFDELPLFDEGAQWGGGGYSTDVGLFMIDIEKSLTAWFEKTVREIGYKGLTTLWDMGKQYRNNVTRDAMQVVSMHNYQAHPTDWLSKGSRVEQGSSIKNAGQYWRAMAGTRFVDRPFFIAEYGHVFWSQTRYEEGVLFGALSALQGYQGLMVHSSPVRLDGDVGPIKPFGTGLDPIERANQVATAFLLRRQDVAKSKNYVELRFDDKYLRENGNLNRAPGAGTLLSLICGFGVWHDGTGMKAFGAKPKPVAILNASGGAQVSMTSNTMDVVGNAGADKETASVIEALKSRGLLPQGNLSDPEKGVYQSDTGEIVMETKNNTISVCAPRFEGIATDKPAKRALGAVCGVQSSVPASIAAISLDGLPLPKSSRLLLVYATDALNSGMELSEDHSTLFSIGKAPTLMRTGALSLEMKTEASSFEAWALGIDGSRVQKIPCSVESGALKLSIDTAELEKGPTQFFEIIRYQQER